MPEQDSQSVKRNVFISYSRKDKEFVRRLNDSLDSSEIEAWVDWEGIPPSAEWMDEIARAIEGADAFVFVISPDSLASKVCGEELELGVKNNKKIIPILHRDPQPTTTMHEKLSSHNWVYLREQDNYDSGIAKVFESINVDLEWVRQHTRLLQRAVEWNRKNRNNSFLLQGSDLEDAEHWTIEASKQENREVVPLQAEYISASRRASSKRQRNVMVGISLALVVSVTLGIFALFQRNIAMDQEKIAKDNEAIAKQDERLVWQFPIDGLLEMNSTSHGKPIISTEALTYDLAISPDSRWVLTAEREKNRAVLYDQDNQTTTQLRQNSKVLSVAFGPGNAQAATAGENAKITIWDLTSAEKEFELESPAPVYSIAIEPHGTTLAAGLPNRVLIWDLETREQIADLPQSGNIKSLAYSNDGQMLASASEDGTVHVWDAATGFDGEPIVLRLNGQPLSIDFSPDNRWLAAGSTNTFAFLWDLSSGEEVARLPHSEAVTSVSFSKDGKLLATVSRKVVKFWNVPALPLVPTSKLVDTACSHLIANISENSWDFIFPGETYRLLCPDLPVSDH